MILWGFKAIVFIAICLGGFALVGASSGSLVSLYLIALPFIFVLSLLMYGFGGLQIILKSKLFLLSAPYLLGALLLAPLGVLFGFGPVHLLAASYFSAVAPFSLIFLGFICWGRLENGMGLRAVVAASIFLNFMMALVQMLSVYYGVEAPFTGDLLNYQYDIKNQLSFNYDIRGRATGIFINPNDFGFWAVMMVGYVWIHFKTPMFKNLSFIMLLFCLLASNSRGALLAFIISTLIVYFSYIKAISFRKGITWIWLFLIILLFIFGVEVLNQFSGLSDQSYAFLSRFSVIWGVVTGAVVDENLTGRYSAWSAAIHVMSEYPLGTFVPPETLLNVAADNQYVYVFLQGSVLFLIAYLWLLLRGALLFLKNDFGYLYWCTWVIFFYGFTAYPLNGYSMLMYWVFLGGAIRVSHSERFSHVGVGIRNA